MVLGFRVSRGRLMLRDYLPVEEQDVLQRICHHHGVDDPELIKDLAAFGNWLREDTLDRVRLNRVPQAPFLLTFLSLRGLLTPKEKAS